ncbi:NACHT domain-containing NTPase [Kitasatospora sp. MY 5-36]|uniref:NACHT domain-containing protein n=1 Tax=Kitasatospora sp. MY 5-36 TaxID=1678027 RepID=UPI000670CCD3|nr:NACHT domain-containing protein [Kitasatospora sp. MY 5-36]
MTATEPGTTGAEPGGEPTIVFYGPTAILSGPNGVQNNYFTLRFPDPVETAAQQLGNVVLAQWRQEAALRGLHGPEPIPVRWCARSGGAFGDHPDLTADPVEGSAADLASFAGAFLRLPQRRLVVLGGPGSGKTTLAVLLVIELLRRMREGEPVPVLLSIASWRPRVDHLTEWLDRQLLCEYPYLGLETVRLLRRDRRIMPVLDGLDELPADERPVALEKLNALEDGTPLVLTCRTEDYVEAIDAAQVLRSAAVVEAEPLTAEEASRYLLRSATPQHQDRWRPLTDALTEDPSCPAAEVLTVPLMLWLCRTAYQRPTSGGGPGDLAKRRCFPTPEAIERHLLDSLVPSVYPAGPLPSAQPGRKASGRWSREERNRDPERVSRWLGFLARHLERQEHPDLAWWKLGTAMRLVPRMLLTGFVTGACVALVIGAMDGAFAVFDDTGPPRGLTARLHHGFTMAVLDGLINGLPAFLAFALVHGIGFVFRGAALEPSQVRIRLGGRAGGGARSGSEILARAGVGLAAGLVGGAGIGLLQGVGSTLRSGDPDWYTYGLVSGVVYGVVFGLSAGLTGALMAWFEARVAIASAPDPRDLLVMNRRTVLLQWFMFAPVFGCLVAIGSKPVIALFDHRLWGLTLAWNAEIALRFGLLTTFGAGLGTMLSLTAWGQWTLLARIWLPLTGQLPQAAMTFLEDAHQRGVLRKVGAVYEFRHVRLLEHFARTPGRRHR